MKNSHNHESPNAASSLVRRKLVVITTNAIPKNPEYVNQVPIRDWSVVLAERVPASLRSGHAFRYDLPFIQTVKFEIHESFSQPIVMARRPPFQLMEKGWGEFPMRISIYLQDADAPMLTIDHHLNLRRKRNEMTYELQIPDPSPSLLELLDPKYPIADYPPEKLPSAATPGGGVSASKAKTTKDRKKKSTRATTATATSGPSPTAAELVGELDHSVATTPSHVYHDPGTVDQLGHPLEYAGMAETNPEEDQVMTMGGSALGLGKSTGPIQPNPFAMTTGESYSNMTPNTAAYPPAATPSYPLRPASPLSKRPQQLSPLISPDPGHAGAGTGRDSSYHSNTTTTSQYPLADTPTTIPTTDRMISTTDKKWLRMNELARRLQTLPDEAVWEAVDLVKQRRSSMTYINESVSGEFHFDLFTLGDSTVEDLWELVERYGSTEHPSTPATDPHYGVLANGLEQH
ncbi:transcription factor TFIIF complex subunit Tfg3 [Dispira simplex]|nr:transcription factor TFIIF complex subunit Tfg3 [Dispira simplex]